LSWELTDECSAWKAKVPFLVFSQMANFPQLLPKLTSGPFSAMVHSAILQGQSAEGESTEIQLMQSDTTLCP